MDVGTFFAFVNDPMLKPIWLILGGAVLKRWPEFVNRAIPIGLAVLSGLASLLGALFPAAATVKTAGFVVAVAVAPAGFADALGSLWGNPVVSALVPLWLASGAQSTVKNTRQWAGAGWKVWQAVPR